LQASTSRHALAKQQEELHLAEKDAPSALPREQFYQRGSMSMASPLPLPEYYQHDSVGTKMEKSSSTSQFSRRNGSRRGDRGYGFGLPIATSDSRGPVSELDEISLLHSNY